jgi:DNA-binding NtrC family response regulator
MNLPNILVVLCSWGLPMHEVVRVLVVDNDEGFRTLVASGLAEYDYSTTIASNAEEALDYLESGAPCDVVLTDVVMPGIGGVELRRRAQILRPGLPVVLMSGVPDGLAAAADAGLFALQKPFTRFRMLCHIEAAIGRNSASRRPATVAKHEH